MKDKKGFALIETLITTVVLVTALVALYVLFNNMMIREKRRIYYDDTIYTVRANYIFDIFFEIVKSKTNTDPNYPNNFVDFGELLTEGSDEAGTKQNLNIVTFTCDNEIFTDKEACRTFFNQMQLYKIYVSKYDLSYLSTCESSNSIACINYNMLGVQTKLYLRSLPYVPQGKGYYIIFEFNDTGDNSVCASENCLHQFASIKYGGSNTIINLK